MSLSCWKLRLLLFLSGFEKRLLFDVAFVARFFVSDTGLASVLYFYLYFDAI